MSLDKALTIKEAKNTLKSVNKTTYDYGLTNPSNIAILATLPCSCYSYDRYGSQVIDSPFSAEILSVVHATNIHSTAMGFIIANLQRVERSRSIPSSQFAVQVCELR